jgi:hypothetical protein
MAKRIVHHSRSKSRKPAPSRSQSRPRADAAELAALIRNAATEGLRALAETDAEGWVEAERHELGCADPTEWARSVFDDMAAGVLRDGAELIGALGVPQARLIYAGAFTAAVLRATGGDLHAAIAG